MGVRIRDILGQHIGELRYEPTGKRVRGILGGETLLDSRRAVLVWEPRRVLPTYAVPRGDVACELTELTPYKDAADALRDVGLPDVVLSAPILAPSVPFRVHSGAGVPLEARMPGSSLSAEAFQPEDSELHDYVVFDFDSFDTWLEEEDEAIGHPRDPYWRVDIRNSSRDVEVRIADQTLARSNHARLVFETMLPVRYYFPPDAVQVPLTASSTRTVCPYKGRAGYWSLNLAGQVHSDLAWTYTEPLADAFQLDGYVCFFDERTDLVLDGALQPRRSTPWS